MNRQGINRQELIDALECVTGFAWAPGLFEIPPAYPYGVVIQNDAPALYADNRRFLPYQTFRLELYDTVENPDAEALIEDWLDDLAPAWRTEPREIINPDDDTAPIWGKSYEFEVIPNAGPRTKQ